MTDNQRRQIFLHLGRLEKMDLVNILSFDSEARVNWKEQKIGNFLGHQFKSYFDILILGFRRRFEKWDYFLLPDSFTDPQWELIELEETLKVLVTDLLTFNLEEASVSLEKLIAYQIQFGFWGNADEELIAEKVLRIQELEDEINSMKSEFMSEVKQSREFNQELTEDKNELRAQTGNLKRLHKYLNKDFNRQKLEVENLLVRQQDSLLVLSREIKTKMTSIDKTRSELEAFQLKFKGEGTKENPGLLLETKENIEKIHEELEFQTNLRVYLDDLLTTAVGANLFQTFDNRKKELNSPVKTWTWIVIGFVVLAVVWIYMVFGNVWVFGSDGDGWIPFCLNTLKTLPAIFLLFFGVDRFRRERKYQEEYAFKSAVALTVKAYVDLIKSDENKEKLILESVEGLYRSPVQQKTRKGVDPRQIAKILKKSPELLVELFKNGKS